jgi:glycosyltransferase involved in cell wall biosynthesis
MNNMDNKIDLTICIPAFESNYLLRRALNSIILLKNIKLEILISDDSINGNLLQTVNNFKKDNPDLLVNYHKQKNNLGVAYNKKWLIENSTGTLVSFLEHDDIILNHKFYFDSIIEFKKNNYYKIYIGNTVIEENGIKRNMQMYLPPTYEQLLPLKKHHFIKNFLRTSKFNYISLSWSSIIIDRIATLNLGGFSNRYLMTFSEAKSIKSFHNEENMMFLILVATKYGVKYTSSTVSQRYISSESFSNFNSSNSLNKTLNCEFIYLIRISGIMNSHLFKYYLIKKAIWIGVPSYDRNILKIIGDTKLNRIIILISLLSYNIYSPLVYPFRLIHGYLIRLVWIIRNNPREIINRLNNIIREKM